MNTKPNPAQFHTAAHVKARESEPHAYEVLGAPVDETMPPYIATNCDRLITFGTAWGMLNTVLKQLAEDYRGLVDELRAENDELRRALEAKASHEEIAALRDLRSQFAEVKASAAECSAKVERLDFSLTRIAADRRGPAGVDGKEGKTGARGLRGERGAMGPAGIAGREFAGWDVDGYKITPIMSDGRRGASCDLRPVLEQGYADALVTDDIVASEEYAEERANEIFTEKLVRFRGGS
jgi:hypothetical protein